MPVDKLEVRKVAGNSVEITGANSEAADAQECLLAPVP